MLIYKINANIQMINQSQETFSKLFHDVGCYAREKFHQGCGDHQQPFTCCTAKRPLRFRQPLPKKGKPKGNMGHKLKKWQTRTGQQISLVRAREPFAFLISYLNITFPWVVYDRSGNTHKWRMSKKSFIFSELHLSNDCNEIVETVKSR